MRISYAVLLAAAGLLLGIGGWVYSESQRHTGEQPPPDTVVLDPDAHAPDSVRIRVRVLNGAGTAGLARKVTQLLRDYGYDVVDYATASEETDSTVIEVNAASRVWATSLQRALGGQVSVRERATPLPHVDVTVTLGVHWQPPPQPFRP